MSYSPQELRDRTRKFAIRVVHLYRTLPRSEESRIIGRQVLRSATSVAANYRAVCRARSKAEFIAKVGIVVEEADETSFWLEFLVETEIVPLKLAPLMQEAEELTKIFAASQQTARSSITRSPDHTLAQ
jgi:four helix bundle protein